MNRATKYSVRYLDWRNTRVMIMSNSVIEVDLFAIALMWNWQLCSGRYCKELQCFYRTVFTIFQLKRSCSLRFGIMLQGDLMRWHDGRGGQAHAGARGAPQHDPTVERQPPRPVRAQRTQRGNIKNYVLLVQTKTATLLCLVFGHVFCMLFSKFIAMMCNII